MINITTTKRLYQFRNLYEQIRSITNASINPRLPGVSKIIYVTDVRPNTGFYIFNGEKLVADKNAHPSSIIL